MDEFLNKVIETINDPTLQEYYTRFIALLPSLSAAIMTIWGTKKAIANGNEIREEVKTNREMKEIREELKSNNALLKEAIQENRNLRREVKKLREEKSHVRDHEEV